MCLLCVEGDAPRTLRPVGRSASSAESASEGNGNPRGIFIETDGPLDCICLPAGACLIFSLLKHPFSISYHIPTAFGCYPKDENLRDKKKRRDSCVPNVELR